MATLQANWHFLITGETNRYTEAPLPKAGELTPLQKQRVGRQHQTHLQQFFYLLLGVRSIFIFAPNIS
jgi:hypothetical protein